LEKQARLLLVKHFCVHLQRVLAEGEELSLVGEEDRGRRLLVIAIVARIQYLDPRLLVALSHRQFRSDAVSINQQGQYGGSDESEFSIVWRR
jgi:hypothetical protein